MRYTIKAKIRNVDRMRVQQIDFLNKGLLVILYKYGRLQDNTCKYVTCKSLKYSNYDFILEFIQDIQNLETLTERKL